MTSFRPLAAALAATALLGGCSSIPKDPDGTLEQIRSSGELTVGVAVHPPFTDVPGGSSKEPTGSEVELAKGFAQRLGAEPVWVVGGEEALVARLEKGEVDLLIGGLTDKNPGLTKTGMTRPYDTADAEGKQVKLVMATIPGENALLSELERYLDAQR